MSGLWTFLRKDTRTRRLTILVTLLVLENIWFFSSHYRGTVTFSYDFSVSYHSVPFYWQGAVRAGEFPEWIPYQAFGYPISLNLQSGLFYPPLWIFPATGMTYSVYAAAIVQCLHILAGAFGMFAFARARRMSFAAALIAAVAYQAFGGFFCNAQHVDIVRGYALTPWLLAALTLEDDRSVRWSRSWWVVPIVYLMMTGVYPGQAVACLAFGFGYLAVQIVEARITVRHVATVARAAASRACAIVLGLGLSAISLLPAWIQRDEISRIETATHLTRLHAKLDHIFTTLFYYNYPKLAGDLSMRSLFITVPILFGVFLLRRQTLRQHCSLVLVSLAAAAMMGVATIFELVTRVVPMLGMSRFPIADYRALVAAPLVVLGAHGLVELFERRIRRRSLIVALVLFASFVVLGGYRLHWFGFDTRFVIVLVAVMVLALATLVRAIPAWLLVACVVPLTLYDGHRMHSRVTRMWREAPEYKPYKRFGRELVKAIRADNVERPARGIPRFQHAEDRGFPVLDGYLRGLYTADDYAGSEHLRATIALRASPELTDYLMRASEPRVVAVEVPDAVTATRAASVGSAATVHYAAERVEYRASTQVDGILVENEPSFRGWRGYLDCDSAKEQSPLPAYWPLRAWRLPKGVHSFCARYSTPGLEIAVAITLSCLALWIAAGGWLIWRRRARLISQPS